MRIKGVVLILVICLCGKSFGQTQKSDMEVLAKYIMAHQFSGEETNAMGAIWTFTIGTEDDTIYKVIPYFGHVAARGLLKTGVNNHSNVKSWMNWYIAHLDSTGRAVNHYYHADGKTDSIVGPNDIDAQDADPALFWMLASEYFSATGDKMFFSRYVKGRLETAEKFIADSLTDVDGLSFANLDFAMKYTMDNAELYAGLNALATIEKEVYKDNTRYSLYKTKAEKLQKAIALRLFDPVSGIYKNSANMKTNPTHWYDEGVVATLWPQLCGVETYSSPSATRQRDLLSQNFNEKNGKDWTGIKFVKDSIPVDTYPWASVGYIFSQAGDTTAGHKQLSYIISFFKDPEMISHININEAGWALLHLATIYKKP